MHDTLVIPPILKHLRLAGWARRFARCVDIGIMNWRCYYLRVILLEFTLRKEDDATKKVYWSSHTWTPSP